jgi:hypothetical protein
VPETVADLTIVNDYGTLQIDNDLIVTDRLLMEAGDVRPAAGSLLLYGPTNSWTGGVIDFINGSGSLENHGTMTIDTTAGNLIMSGRNGAGLAQLTNSGTIDLAGGNNLFLNAASTLTNEGTFNIDGDASISHSYSDGTLVNAGTLEKTGGTGTSTISSGLANSAAITVQTGTLALASSGGTNSGGTFSVSAGATLDLTGGSTVAYQGIYTGSGGGTVLLASGVLAVTNSGATFNMPGSLFQWTGGTIDVSSSGTLTNAPGSVLNLDTTTYNLVLNGNGTSGGWLANQGTINEAGSGNLDLNSWPTLTNAAGATFDIIGDAGISHSYRSGKLANAGTLEKTGGTGTTMIDCASFSNTGIVLVASGTTLIPASVAQVSGGTLTAGTWMVKHSATSNSTLDITSAGTLTTIGSSARVTLNGLNTTFSNLSGLNFIQGGGRFTLAAGQSFATTGVLTNDGRIALSPGSVLTVSGDYTQASTGTLTIQLGGTTKAPTFGQLVSTTGTVTLGGSLKVTSKVVPAVNSSFDILDNETNSPVSGDFTGLTEGATFTVKKGTTVMTFQVTYAGNDGDGTNNLIITRIA